MRLAIAIALVAFRRIVVVAGVDNLLLESGDNLLLESGDLILME